MEEKESGTHSSEEGRREIEINQIVRGTFKTDPLFHTLGHPGQISKK